jgi:hypothetical protein
VWLGQIIHLAHAISLPLAGTQERLLLVTKIPPDGEMTDARATGWLGSVGVWQSLASWWFKMGLSIALIELTVSHTR